jgi:hypothetical protein
MLPVRYEHHLHMQKYSYRCNRPWRRMLPVRYELHVHFKKCMVIQLWKCIKHLKNPEDGDSTFSETSVRAIATRYQVHEDIFNQALMFQSPLQQH